MFRHYLPSIAAAIALLFIALWFPISNNFGNDNDVSLLTASSVSAQTGNQCTETTVGVSLLMNVDTKNPEVVDVTDPNDQRGIIGKDGFGNWHPDSLKAPYNPPLLLTKVNIGCCFGLHRFFLNDVQVLEENWGGSLIKDYTSRPGGGVLFDTYQNLTANGVFMRFAPATHIKYTVANTIVNTIANPSDANTVDMGSIKTLLGSNFKDTGSGAMKVTQKVKITFSGQGKMGLGNADSNTNRNQSDGSITVDSAIDDFNQHLFVCKDSQGNGICDATECSNARPPACGDGLDNDGDKKIDFPGDPGCSAESDTDETDAPPPPVDRTIVLKRGAQPTIVTQPLLKALEVIKFTTTCANCTIRAVPDPATFKAGTPEADNGFMILATLVNNADQSLSHTIVLVGDAAEENSKLSTAEGLDYISQGIEKDTHYPASILANGTNDYFVKARVDNLFEQVEVSPTPLPSVGSAVPQNGSVTNVFFQGIDSTGKKHVLITKARYWDANTLADPALTPEPFLTFFQSKGALASCITGLQTFPNIGTLFENPTGFQLFLDLLTLCQR